MLGEESLALTEGRDDLMILVCQLSFMLVKAAIYARQSMENDEGIERQITRCRKLAQDRGWDVIAEFKDNAVSANKVRKGAWLELLASKAEVVVAVDLDRLLRSQRDLITLIDSGIRVVTVDGEIDLSAADGEFRATILASIARFEVRRKGERQIRANKDRVAKGLPTIGKTRFGYEIGNRRAHPVEGPIVADLFQRIKDSQPIFKLAKELGKSTVTVRGMLTNRAYCGWVRHDGEWYPVDSSVDRLVTQELFDEVQIILNDDSRKLSPGGQVAYLASGLARCGVCEGPMHSRSQNYLCTADLSHPCIKKDLLDDALMWEVWDLILLPNENAGQGELSKLLTDRSAKFARRKELTELLLTPYADLNVIRKSLAALAKEMELLDEEVVALKTADITVALIADLKIEIEAVRSVKGIQDVNDLTLWWKAKWAALPLDTRRELVRSLRVVVHEGRGFGRVLVTRV
ncbi:recombinase family protein [Salinibacterium sp. SWN139]|uniref:recombinase family protein n=1 Tax=Salinibacterium sp. SWN139 TaxID=2792055 RepID=UPI0018CE5319|nr:recombinase family protein [Salinibacterium sp. SWN139]MBH0052694.1 recombinase family protein [Salinibacterium sp. SWN139]